MKIIFLDRDGVINTFPGNGKYVTKVKDFRFIPGSIEAIRLLIKSGYKIFVISNQAGVGKGLFSKKKLEQITCKMLREVNKKGGKIHAVHYSIRRSDENCPYRKPNTGSVEKAMKSLKKKMHHAKNAYFIGDTEVDIKTGKNVGCRTIFVLSGREDRVYMRRWDGIRPDFIARNLYEATTKIILNDKGKA